MIYYEYGVCWTPGCRGATSGYGYCKKCSASIEASRGPDGLPAPAFYGVTIRWPREETSR